MFNNLDLFSQLTKLNKIWISRAKWFDQGEKSNKYFLNLNKKYPKKKIIDKIICEGVTSNGQEGVANAITGFYQRLYSKGATVTSDDDEFYRNCPTLSDDV